MRTDEISVTTTCPACGTRLTSGTCPACALGQLLSGGGELSDYEDVTPQGPAGKLEPGEVAFGRYVLKERIAAGGMGVVYAAEDRKLKRRVALKMIRGSTFANASEIARFTLEAEAAAALDHPNIVPIYEIGHLDGQPFFTMKEIEGESLAQRLKATGGTLPVKEVAALLCRIARAVQHAHQRGVLHRDLKPGNILLDKAGTPWLTDFGLAKLAHAESELTLSSDHIGTPDYMSPESAVGKAGEVSTACDVWALGVLLWEMLYGVKPFHGATTVETLRRIVEEEPLGPRGVRADEDLVTLARRCLEKDACRRPVSAGEVADELERWTRGEPILARRVSAWERGWKWVRRSKLLAALYAALALGGISSLVLWQHAEEAVVSLTEKNDQLGVALRISTATKLAVDARIQISEDPARALLLAVESVEQTERHGGGVLPEAVEALHAVLQQAGGKDVSPLGPGFGGANDGFIDRRRTAMYPVAMSPDGSRMVMVDYARAAEKGVVAAVFDPHDQERTLPLARWQLSEPEFSGCMTWCWLSDSRLFATLGSGDELRLWDLGEPGQTANPGVSDDPPPRRLLGDLTLEGKYLRRVNLHCDADTGRLSAFGFYTNEGEDTTDQEAFLGVFEADPLNDEPGLISRVYPLPTGFCTGVEHLFSPDGRWLLGTGHDRDIAPCLIDLHALDGGNAWVELPEGKGSWVGPTFAPQGTRLALVRDQKTVRTYDLRAGALEEIAKSGEDVHQCDESVSTLCFSHDDGLLAMGTDGREIVVASTENPGEIHSVRLAGATPMAIGFSPNGQWLAAGGKDRIVSVWPVGKLGKAPTPLQFRGLTTPVMEVAFSSDQASIIGTGMHCDYRQWEFRDFSSGVEPRTLPGTRDYINDLAVSPNEEWVATACGDPVLAVSRSTDGKFKLTRIRDGREFELLGHAQKATGVAFSPDGRWLACTGRDGMARVWEFPEMEAAIKEGKPLPAPRHVLDMTDTRLNYDRRVAIHPRGILYATCGDGLLFAWDLKAEDPDAGREFYSIHSIRYLLPDVRISKDGRRMAVCRHGWDREPKEGSRQSGNMVLLFDVSVPGPPVPVTELPAQFLDTSNVDFSPDGRWLAAGGAGAGATVWDLDADDIAGSRVISEVSSHYLSGLAFSPDGKNLGLGGSDGRLHLWNWREHGQQRTIASDRAMESLAWIGRSTLVTGGESGVLALWETNIAVLKERARKIAGRELSDLERARFRIGE